MAAAFTGGNKHTPGSPYYDNVPLWAARNGLVGVNITYRLAPEGQWPSGAEDVGAALRWVADNIGKFGGDPAKIILFGHSAGATHSGTYAAMPQFHGPDGIGLAGLILTSGIYDLTTFPLTDNYRSYIGDDASLYAERSPITRPRQARHSFHAGLRRTRPAAFHSAIRKAGCGDGQRAGRQTPHAAPRPAQPPVARLLRSARTIRR